MRTVVYSKPMCPFCDKAKALLKKLEVKFETIEVGKDISVQKLTEEFEANGMPAPRSVPQIILNGKYIGGYDSLTKYVEDTGFNGTGHSI